MPFSYVQVFVWLAVMSCAVHVGEGHPCFGLNMMDLRRVVRNAIADARTALQSQKTLNNFLSAVGIDEPIQANMAARKSCNQHYSAFISNTQDEITSIIDSGFIVQRATKLIVEHTGVNLDRLLSCPILVNIWREEISPFCMKFVTKCDPKRIYRSHDGSCNNLVNPLWGRSNRMHYRHLMSVYEDGLDTPRQKSITGEMLPSPRTISNTVHRQDPCCPLVESSLSQFVQQFAQAIDHDVTDTAIAAGANETSIMCCDIPKNLLRQRSECFPIWILPGDERFHNTHCMNFVRAVTVHNGNCDMGRREQLNTATSYIDASFLYGHTEQFARQLRLYQGGRLRMTEQGLFPPRTGDNRFCMITYPKDYCMVTGDTRIHIMPGLTAIFVIFLREHNRIASILQHLNPHWSDEIIFQETRKIVIGELQHIAYNDWLPLIIGQRLRKEMRLKPKHIGYDNVYNPAVDATISNVFGVSAFRFAHSLLDDNVLYTKGGGQTFRLDELFNRPTLVLQPFGATYLAQGLARKALGKADGLIVESVRDNLFLDEQGRSFDLISLNIQRGRDHGVAGYNAWRRFCGLPYAIHFGTGKGGLIDHTAENARKLRSVYRHPDDIDVFSGGISETPVKGGVVGPLFACIIGIEFQKLKFGDRFYYENNNKHSGFTFHQLNSVKQMSLAKLMCLHLHIPTVQVNPFLLPSPSNKEVDCRTFPDINFSFWKA